VTHLYLVRHGETDWNAARRIQGSTDIPLNDTGRAQARATGRRLAARRFDRIVASPLSRAFETAGIIADEIGASGPEALDDLVERRYGQAEGLDYRTLHQRFPSGTPVPGRETRDRVAARVLPALLRLVGDGSDARILAVTHGGVIRSVLTAVAPDAVADGVPIPNGSVHSFQALDGRLELIAFDDPVDAESAPFEEQNPLAAREQR